MDPSNTAKQRQPEEPRFLDFPHLPDDATRDGKLVLNRYSSILTNEHDFPGAQVRELASNATKANGLSLARQCSSPQGCQAVKP